MNNSNKVLLLLIILLATTAITCQLSDNITTDNKVTPTSTPSPTFTPLPSNPIQPGAETQNEPVFIFGDIPYTSPFFLNSVSEPFVLLEDQAGFILHDKEHIFTLESQTMGPVEVHDDLSLTYGLALPSVPQGTFFDVDNNGKDDQGVQVFAVAYWSNTWDGPFLEERDGTGWSNAYTSTITDPNNDDEIIGGTLIVWSPDDKQGFPSGFGNDGLLFTEDDPVVNIPAGYNLVDLDQTPFYIYKESRPEITLNEGEIAVNDYSDLNYAEAFKSLFDKASREYPFTEDKHIQWQELYDKYAPQIENVRNADDFYRALRDFTLEIPDGHVGISFNADVFYSENGGSFGMLLSELSDGKIIVNYILPNGSAEKTGIQVGAEIITWNGQPVSTAIDNVIPYFGPYSTEHAKRLDQLLFLTRVPPGSQATVEFRNPGESEIKQEKIKSEVEYDTLFLSIPSFNEDDLALPIQGKVLDDSQLGYIRVVTFSDDYRFMAQLWEKYIQSMIDNEVPGLILDLRTNSGGSGGLAYDFAGFFFDEEVPLYRSSYYNEDTGQFEYTDYPARIKPAPIHYDGPIAVLVSPECVSACEGFAYALTRNDRAIVVGHYPSAGAFGEVGRGQYDLPDEINMQFPTGRPETFDGELLIEGVGVIPDILVPVTIESALKQTDTVLDAAINALLDQIN